MRFLLITLLAAISYAQTVYSITTPATKMCMQQTFSNDCPAYDAAATAANMQKTACDTSVYKKQCGAMDAESPMDIGECGKYQARSFFEDCSTCASGCVDAPTSGGSGSNDGGSGSNDGGSGDTGTVAVCDDDTSTALGLLVAGSTAEGCKTMVAMALDNKEPTDAQRCDCLTTLGDNAVVKMMKCRPDDEMSTTIADLAAGKGECASAGALSIFFAVAAVFFGLM